jgi:hypothetical protein
MSQFLLKVAEPHTPSQSSSGLWEGDQRPPPRPQTYRLSHQETKGSCVISLPGTRGGVWSSEKRLPAHYICFTLEILVNGHALEISDERSTIFR